MKQLYDLGLSRTPPDAPEPPNAAVRRGVVRPLPRATFGSLGEPVGAADTTSERTEQRRRRACGSCAESRKRVSRATFDIELYELQRLYMTNRGIWEAISSAGPACGVQTTTAGTDRYLDVLDKFLQEASRNLAPGAVRSEASVAISAHRGRCVLAQVGRGLTRKRGPATRSPAIPAWRRTGWASRAGRAWCSIGNGLCDWADSR